MLSHVISVQVEALTAGNSPVEAVINGGMFTPTSSPAPPPMTHSVAMPTPLLQAVFDRTSQQPLYILQSGNGPALIPLQGIQGIQMAAPARSMPGSVVPAVTPTGTANITNSAIAIPTSLSVDQLTGRGGIAPLHTPSPGTPKALTGPFGGSLEGLMQPSQFLLPQNNGGMQLSEAGPIRTIVRQAAKERPSPVAMDGKMRGCGGREGGYIT